MSRRLVIAGAALMVIAFAFTVPVFAAKAKKAEEPPKAVEIAGPAVIDKTFDGFRFGMTKDELEEFVKGRVRAYYTAEMAKTKDVRKSDDLLQAMNARLQTVATDWIAFDGSKAGWNVSIIRFEFKTGLGEEALHVAEGYEHFYYFLSGGKVYKLVRAWDAKAFAPVKEALIKAYGKASFTMRPGDYDRRFLSDMRWHGTNVTVDVEDWTEAFNSYTVRWADTATDEAVMKTWGNPEEGLPKLNPLIDTAREPPPKNAKDPVDDILGR